jgi:hypothetical protein
MLNILAEFEKRYKGDPSQTENICKEIADKFGLDVEETTDYVYINRYNENDPELENEPEDLTEK